MIKSGIEWLYKKWRVGGTMYLNLVLIIYVLVSFFKKLLKGSVFKFTEGQIWKITKINMHCSFKEAISCLRLSINKPIILPRLLQILPQLIRAPLIILPILLINQETHRQRISSLHIHRYEHLCHDKGHDPHCVQYYLWVLDACPVRLDVPHRRVVCAHR